MGSCWSTSTALRRRPSVRAQSSVPGERARAVRGQRRDGPVRPGARDGTRTGKREGCERGDGGRLLDLRAGDFSRGVGAYDRGSLPSGAPGVEPERLPGGAVASPRPTVSLTLMIRSSAPNSASTRRACLPKTIAVAAAEADHTLRAVGDARRRGWADAVLVGDEAVIRSASSPSSWSRMGWTSSTAPGNGKRPQRPSSWCGRARPTFCSKGAVSTAVLMHAVLDRDCGTADGQGC